MPGSGAPLGIEYKVAAAPPPPPTAAPGAAAPSSIEPDWQWQPGANRKLTLAAATGAEPAPLVVAQEKWFPRRDGTGVIASDPYLEPHKGHLQHRCVCAPRCGWANGPSGAVHPCNRCSLRRTLHALLLSPM